MNTSAIAKRILILSCLLTFQLSAVAADAVLEQAKKLVADKKPADAYALLLPLQSERAGESGYDYLLGISALDSGKPAEAVFAFERFLAMNPDNGPARLELARAHYMMGDVKASQEEFETVKRQQPPEQVKQAIQDYLSAIDRIASSEGTRVRGYVEVGGGRDTNANSATSSSQIAIPELGGAIGTLDPAFSQKSDNFLSAMAGVSMRHSLSPEWALNASGALGQRRYSNVRQFDIGNIDASAGLTRTIGVDQFTTALQYQKVYVDRSAYRQTYGLLGQWQHSIDEQRQLTIYGQGMRLAYSGLQEIRNADRYLAGTAYSQAFAGRFQPIAYGGLYAGTERPRASTVPHLSNNFAGVRIGGQLSLAPSTALVASASVEHRSYRGAEPGFLVDRSDRQIDVSLALVYSPATEWVIRPEISHSRNRSNVVLNDYARAQVLVTVRRNFN